MAHGYYLVQQGDSLPVGSEEKWEPLGLLDFLREIGAEDASVPKFWNVVVTGLEEVLFAATERETMALEIRRRLGAGARLLQNRLASVVIVFRGQLKRGEDLWVEYRGKRLPIGHIFGSPTPHNGPRGSHYYFATFNLTNGG